MNLKELQKCKLKTKSGLPHGLINVLVSSVSKPKIDDPKIKEKMEKERERSEELVQARYINHQDKNGRLETPYMEYAGQPLTQWKFINGHEYLIPRGLLEIVNEMHTKTKKRSGILDKEGIPTETDSPADIEHEFVGVI